MFGKVFEGGVRNEDSFLFRVFVFRVRVIVLERYLEGSVVVVCYVFRVFICEVGIFFVFLFFRIVLWFRRRC